MANAEVFKIMGSVLLEDDQFIRGLKNVLTEAESATSKLSRKFESVGRAFQNVGNKMQSFGRTVTLGTTVAVGAVGSLTKAAITAYADYEQLVGGVETLFKKSNKKVLAYAQEAYKTAGLSANDYMATVTSFSASLLQSLGGDTEKAAEYSNRAVTDMSDNANKMGTDMSMIQNAYQGFAKQNYTMLDNLKLGYGGTKTEMERLIKDASKMKDVQKELNITVDEGDLSFGNIVNAISVVQSKMGIMGTTAKEAEGTISGSINTMKGAWKNFLVGMADDEADFEDLFNKLIQSVETVAKNLLPRIEIVVTTALKKILEGIKKLVGDIPIFGDLIDKLLELTTKFRELDTEQKKQVLSWTALVLCAGPLITIFGKITSGVGLLISGVGKIIPLFGGGEVGLAGVITKATTACGGLAPFFGIIAGAIVALVATIKVLKENWDKLSEAFKKFAENIGLTQTIENLKKRFSELWESLKGLEDLFNIIGVIVASVLVPAFHLLVAGINVVLSVIDPLIKILSGLLDILGSVASFIVGVFTLDLQKCGDAVEKLIGGIAKVFEGAFGLIIKPVKALVEGIVGFFEWLFDILVGHSIVPDMIDAIIDWFKKLLGKPIEFVKNMVSKVVGFFSDLGKKAGEKFKAIGTTITKKTKEISTNVVNKFNDMKTNATKKMSELVTNAKNKFESIKSTMTTKMSQARTKVSDAFSKMSSSAKDKLSSLSSTVSDKFGSIATKIGDKMKDAKNKVSDMLSQMKKSFSNFTAKIKLPHFKIKNASINPKDWITKGAPKLSVEWYKKGGIFDKPTIFNTQSGLKGVGEAGPEAVTPISVLQGYVRDAVVSQNAEIENRLNTLIDILLKFLPRLENQSLVLDTGVLVGELTPKFDKSLGELTQKKIRGR